MVPYPNEHSMMLGLELINVFKVDVLVTDTVGSGEVFKAVLQKHKFGIGVCKTATQKKLVMDKLKGFAKMMNLVSLTDAPAKSAELKKYEEQAQPAGQQALIPPQPPAPVDHTSNVSPVPQPPVPAPLPQRTPPLLAAFGSSLL